MARTKIEHSDIGTWKRDMVIERHYLDNVAAYLNGNITQAGSTQPPRGLEIHASDLNGCPLPAFYQKTNAQATSESPLYRETILRFVRGIAVENILRVGKKTVPAKIVDNIYCRVDDIIEGRIIEIKSTILGMSSFDPFFSVREWVERIGMYCHAYETTEAVLVVFFISGNMSDFLPWAKDRKPGQRYSSTDLRAYHMSFKESFLSDNWEEALARKTLLEEAIKQKDVEYLKDEVFVRREPWMCKSCRFITKCKFSVGSRRGMET